MSWHLVSNKRKKKKNKLILFLTSKVKLVMTATKVKMVAKARIMMYYKKILKKMGILIIQVNNSTKVIAQA